MEQKKNYSKTIYIIIAALFIYQMTLLGTFISSYEKVSIGMILLCIFFIVMGLVIDGIVFYVSRSIQKKLEMDEELKELYRFRELETALYKNIQLQLELLREQRHEFANQIQTAYIMIEQGAPKETLEKYLEELEECCQTE